MAFHLTGLARAASAAPQTPSTTPSRTKSNEEYERKMPEEKFRMMDLEIGLLLNRLPCVHVWLDLLLTIRTSFRTWQPRRFIMTRDALHFAFSRDDNEIDHIPLAEITNSGIMKDAEHGGTRASFSGPRRNSVSLASHGLYTIHIATENDGYNSGRVYYLQAESNEINDRLLLAIQENSKAARKRKASRNIWQRAQRRLNEWFNSTPVQAFVIAVISLNFGVTILQTQLINHESHSGSESDSSLWDRLNIAFVLFFLAELAINAFANWYVPFVSNPWNLFDALVIMSSLLLALIPGQSVGLKTSLQAGRVLRILGKIEIFKTIVNALAIALVPVLSVFFILLLFVSIGAVHSVSVFGERYPEHFGMFDVAFVTLFFVTAGEPWPDEVRELTEDGKVRWSMMSFCFIYTIGTFWIFLQVCFTVLLDNFIAASSRMALEKKLMDAQMQKNEQQMKNPLEPLLLSLAREFSDDQDLSDRLQRIYQLLDHDNSGGVGCAEFCASMRKLHFDPPIHVTASDFASLTQDGELCDANGELGPDEFEAAMRKQIQHFAQSKLSLITEERSMQDLEFMQFGSLKMIFMEQVSTIKLFCALFTFPFRGFNFTQMRGSWVVNSLRLVIHCLFRREPRMSCAGFPSSSWGPLLGRRPLRG
mmetsp:Transcript_52853/g.139104  ORF Transcript_52853/g.139104 Transcript_52853/m.139104 type:complete len:648 (+) Transcript_52853:92-2035(+)